MSLLAKPHPYLFILLIS